MRQHLDRKTEKMRWVKTTLSSVWGIVGQRNVPNEIELADRTEGIRDSMLDLLAEPGIHYTPALLRRVTYAQDLEALWYLRSDLMMTVAAAHGEASAQAHMQRISNMFDGLLPQGLQTRPSPLQ
jgi:hypothetical protein